MVHFGLWTSNYSQANPFFKKILIVCDFFMCIQKGAGKGRMNWVADEYNKKQNTNYSLNLSPSIIKCNAPKLQDNYGLGLTFSMNF